MKLENLRKLKKLYDNDPSGLQAAENDALDELEKMQQSGITQSNVRRSEYLLDLVDYARMPIGEPAGLEPGIIGGEYGGSGGPFRSFGEQIRAVIEAGRPGGKTDTRLYEVRASGLQEAIPHEGGFLVQSDFSQQLIGSLYGPSRLPGMCRNYPIGKEKSGLKMPGFDETSRADGSRWGGVRAYWLNEAATKTSSKPKFRLMELDLVKLIGLCYLTDELLEDVPLLEQYVRDAFRDEFLFKLEDSIINGTGAGQMLGVLNAGALISVSKETGQTADTIIWENILKMIARFRSMGGRPVWLTNQDCLPQLLQMYMPVGTAGVPVYVPGSQNSLATLCGWPVIFSEASATLGDKGDIILMDTSAFLTISKGGSLTGGIQFASSIHVAFTTDETALRFVLRTNGQPMLAAPVTPYKGTNTVGPFVTLNARA